MGTIIDWANEAAQYEGDFVEIGAGNGNATIELLKIAMAHEKHVFVIDPFESGWSQMPDSYGKPYPHSEFMKNVESFPNMVLCVENSLTVEAQEFINRPLCFAFIDGLQYKGAVLSDLRICSHARIIVVDDMDRSTGQSQVPSAIDEFMLTNQHRTLTVYGRYAVIR